jgi:hypothetical protein
VRTEVIFSVVLVLLVASYGIYMALGRDLEGLLHALP